MASVYSDLDRPPLDERSLQRALMLPAPDHEAAGAPDAHGRPRGSSPDERGLNAHGVAVLRVLPEVDSTNAALALAAAAGAPHGSVLVAEAQTAGRGRQGRTWTAPPRSGLFLSVLVRPVGVPQAGWGWLPLLAGVAVRSAVARITDLTVALKWPNDLIIPDRDSRSAGPSDEAGGYGSGRKLGGILCERTTGPAPCVVVGIGVNVSLRAAELPAPHATSVAIATGRPADRDPILRALLREFGSWYSRWEAAAGDSERCGLADTYRTHCATVGAQVRVDLPGGGSFAGTAADIDPQGRLVVDAVDGSRRSVAAGDVAHLR